MLIHTKQGELLPTEPHPAFFTALMYVRTRANYPLIKEAFASCAIENNRLAEICLETLRRLEAGEPVSDRYLLGLAWALKEMDENDHS